MKKLFMFVAVAALVFAGQAAQFDWKYNASSADVGKTVYVILGTTAKTDWASIDDVKAAAVNGEDGTKIAKKGVKYNASGTAIDDDITKTSASAYYVIVSKDGTSYDVTSVADFKSSVYDPSNQESSAGENTSLSNASIASSGNSFGGGGGGGGTDPAPEPTSGLLLLVGAGLLGLRRKRA